MVLLLLFLFGILFIGSTDALVNNIYRSFVNDARSAIHVQEERQKRHLKEDIIFIQKILGSVLSESLYFFEEAPSELLPFMEIEEIYAITVFDEDKKPYVAAWKEGDDIKLSTQLPEDYPLTPYRSVALAEIRSDNLDNGLVGYLKIYYSELSLETTFKTQRVDLHKNLSQRKRDVIQIHNQFMGLQFLGLTAVIIIILLVIFYLITKLIKVPISYLQNSANELAQGNLDYPIDLSRKDELGDLAHSFSDMRDAIQEKVTRLHTEIENKKQAEKEVRVFKTISDTANYGALIVDFNYNITYANAYQAKIHGYETTMLIGKHYSIFFNEVQWKKIEAQDKRLKEQGVLNTIENWHTRKDSSTFPMVSNYSIIREDKKKASFIAIESLDITGIKRSENKVRLKNKRLEQDLSKNIEQIETAQAEIETLSQLNIIHSFSSDILNLISNLPPEPVLPKQTPTTVFPLSKSSTYYTDSSSKPHQQTGRDRQFTSGPLNDPHNKSTGTPQQPKGGMAPINPSDMRQRILDIHQTYISKSFQVEKSDLKTLLEDCLLLVSASIPGAGVEFTKEYSDIPEIRVSSLLVLQLITHLVKIVLASLHPGLKRISLNIGQISESIVFFKITYAPTKDWTGLQSEILDHKMVSLRHQVHSNNVTISKCLEDIGGHIIVRKDGDKVVVTLTLAI